MLSAGALLAAATVLTSVPDILDLRSGDESHHPDAVVTGVVTSVFRWQESSCLLASEDDIDGPAVYVGGMMPGRPRAVVRGAEQLNRGNRVVVRGCAQPMLLEPGLGAEEIEVIGHVTLPPPAIRRPAEILLGAHNNRRVTVEGVFWGVQVIPVERGEMTVFRLGTKDGPLTLHLAGAHPELAALRNHRVRAEGVALPMCNARGEFLSAEIEAFSADGIRPIGDARVPPVIDVTSSWRGVLAWRQNAPEGHLRRVCGQVVYTNPAAGFFVVRPQAEDPSSPRLSVRVDATDGGGLPTVGDRVETEGFPTRLNDCGILVEGVYKVLAPSEEAPEPETIGGEALRLLLTHNNELDEDYSYRFVRLCGRVTTVSRRGDREYELRVETPSGSLIASLPDAGEDFVERFIDRPMVDLTGVLDTHLVRNASNGRVLAVGEVELLLRTEADIVIVPDDEARSRRFGRLVRQVLLVSIAPLFIAFGWFLIAAWRRRALAMALAQDRKRTAEALHDTVSQQLAGARMMIFSAKSQENVAPDVRENLGLAIEVLESARREVRDAVLRLKNDDFSLKSVETLLRECAEKASSRNEIRATTRLCSFPDWVTGEVKTDLLSIVQEAITNAVRHGKAKRVAILAERQAGGGLVVSVLNDGEPFEASRALGPETGHFGLSGMRERAERNGFSLAFTTRKGWMEVRLERKGR